MSMPLHFPELSRQDEGTMGNMLPLGQVAARVAPPEATVGSLWHYTGAAAAMAILRSNSLRAGLPMLMNDPLEMVYGAEVIERYWADHRPDFRHPDQLDRVLDYAVNSRGYDEGAPPSTYILSASSAMDSLAQYRAYGSHSIGIDPSQSLTPKGKLWGPSAAQPVRLGWLPVQYTSDGHAGQARRLIETYDEMLDDWPEDENLFTIHYHVKTMYSIACAYIKAPAYQVENEFRYVLTDGTATDYYVGRFDAITPCVDLVTELATDLFTELRIGPGKYPDLAAIGAKNFVGSLEKRIPVSASPVQARI